MTPCICYLVRNNADRGRDESEALEWDPLLDTVVFVSLLYSS